MSGTHDVSSKPRGGAIVYGIEGSKVVLAYLERTKVDGDIAFLKPIADNATAILCTMREIREGDVEDEFASLALDACGLAFILINECYRSRRDHIQVPNNLMRGSNELAEYLRDDVHSFVQKQISRDLLKVDFMYDDEIAKFREELRLWMGKMGIQTDLSIHDKVEAIISERMMSQHEEARVLQSSTSNLEPFKHLDGKGSAEEPLLQIPVSDTRNDRGLKDQTGPTGEDGSNNDETPNRSSSPDDTKKREEERVARKAKRDRWRRSNQESRLLQKTTTPTRPGPSRPTSVAISDNELAHRLQAQLTREIEEEDEKRALEIGIMLHHQWDAEEKLQAQLAKEIEEEDEKKALDIATMLHDQWEAEDLESNSQLQTQGFIDSRGLKPQTRCALSMYLDNQHQHPLSRVRARSKANGELVSNRTRTEPTCCCLHDDGFNNL